MPIAPTPTLGIISEPVVIRGIISSVPVSVTTVAVFAFMNSSPGPPVMKNSTTFPSDPKLPLIGAYTVPKLIGPVVSKTMGVASPEKYDEEKVNVYW